MRPELERAGWLAEELLWMVLRPGADQRGEAAPAQAYETRLEGFRTLAERWHGEAMSREAARAVVDAESRNGEAFAMRGFVAAHDGEPAAYAMLIEHAAVGEIDQVYTAPEARGHGLASVVVRAAGAAALQRGAELVVIGADAADWPRLLYERLGFETVGTRHGFTLPSVR